MTATQKIDAILVSLASPLSVQEAEDGWTAESKKAMADYFQDLRKRVSSGEVPSSVVHITRAMDHWGVSAGPLLELAAAISNELRITGGQ
jgi:hypothetical protein